MSDVQVVREGRRDVRRPLHVSWGKALLLGLQLFRLYVALARIYAYVPAYAEGVAVGETLVCRWFDCDRTRAATDDDFCVQHAYEARLDGQAAVAEASHLTDYAAQFEQWCADHDKPHPHHED